MTLDRIEVMPALRARWRLIVLVWLGVVAAVLAVTLLLPPRYESSATLVVEMNAADPVRGQDMLRPAGALSAYMATQVDVIRSEAVARRALQSLGLDRSQDWIDDWRTATDGRGDLQAWLAARLLRKLAVVPSRDSNVVTVSYTSPDAAFSAAVANAFVQAYVDTTLQMRAAPARQFNVFFEERAHSLRQTLDQAKARLSAYEQKNGLIVSEAQEPDVESTRLAELTSQLVALQDEATDAANRQRQAAQGANRMREVRNDPEVMELTAQLAREQASLSKLLTEFGERHPAVVQAQRSIADLRARLSGSMQRAATTLGVPVRANEARLAEVRKAIERQRTLVLQRRSQRNAAAALLRDVENAQRAYDAVLQRASETALQAASTTQPNVSVVKSATAPALPLPLLRLNLIVALLLGPLIGMAAALAREARDRRLRTVQDITQRLQQVLLLRLPDGLARPRETARRSLETQRRLVSPQPRLFGPR